MNQGPWRRPRLLLFAALAALPTWMQATPALEIVNGVHCQIGDDGCATDGDTNYGNLERCTIAVTGTAGLLSAVGTFDVRSPTVTACHHGDYLEIIRRGGCGVAITLSDVPPDASDAARAYAGVYVVVPNMNSGGRPVYRHEDDRDKFLYATTGVWQFSPSLISLDRPNVYSGRGTRDYICPQGAAVWFFSASASNTADQGSTAEHVACTSGCAQYCGTTGPANVQVEAGTTIRWNSDLGNNQYAGWKLCVSAPETGAPTTAPITVPLLQMRPTPAPTSSPATTGPSTATPTANPTTRPTPAPTSSPATAGPTSLPTDSAPETGAPTTAAPTSARPTANPTTQPTPAPTSSPATTGPSSPPTNAPSAPPTGSPATSGPTEAPSTALNTTTPATLTPTLAPTGSDLCGGYTCSADCEGLVVFGGQEFSCGWDNPTSSCRRGFITSDDERAARSESIPGGCVPLSSADDPEKTTKAPVVVVALLAVCVLLVACLAWRRYTGTTGPLNEVNTTPMTQNPMFSSRLDDAPATGASAGNENPAVARGLNWRGEPKAEPRPAPTENESLPATGASKADHDPASFGIVNKLYEFRSKAPADVSSSAYDTVDVEHDAAGNGASTVAYAPPAKPASALATTEQCKLSAGAGPPPRILPPVGGSQHVEYPAPGDYDKVDPDAHASGALPPRATTDSGDLYPTMNAGVAAVGATRHHSAPISARPPAAHGRRLDLAAGIEVSDAYERLDVDGMHWSTDQMIDTRTKVAARGNSNYDVLHDNNRPSNPSNVGGAKSRILAPSATVPRGSGGYEVVDQSCDYAESPTATVQTTGYEVPAQQSSEDVDHRTSMYVSVGNDSRDASC